jgi:hypothetical protein
MSLHGRADLDEGVWGRSDGCQGQGDDEKEVRKPAIVPPKGWDMGKEPAHINKLAFIYKNITNQKQKI